MRAWTRPAGYVLGIAVVATAYFIGMGNRGNDDAAAAAELPEDPGYAARDAEVIETGYDGRERYRLSARVIRQNAGTGVIELDQLHMNYHADAQAEVPGESPDAPVGDETWHVRADSGQVRANGDDVELSGNVKVTGPAPGSAAPLELTTSSMRINTPTEFIETDDPVKVKFSGSEMNAVGFEVDLKTGKLRLKSAVHDSSAR